MLWLGQRQGIGFMVMQSRYVTEFLKILILYTFLWTMTSMKLLENLFYYIRRISSKN